jgi:hypothetical protein
MAQVSGTMSTYDQVGIREDLSDVIYNISPTETPFLNSVGKGSADNTYFEWQTDSLAAADNTNAHIEGDETSFSAPAATTRVGNRQQISKKSLIVSGTAERVRKAGRKSEIAYQMAKRGKELKLDMEKILIGTNQAAVTGDDTTARKTGSLLSWVRTNVDKASDGSNPAAPNPQPGGTRTDGTTRAFTETILKNVVALQWAEGGKTDVLMVGSTNKQVVSGFAGIATKTLNFKSAAPIAIVGAADVYVSDFGKFHVVPNRQQRSRDAWFLDLEYISVDYLRPFFREKLAKTGDADKSHMVVEYGLKVKQEKAIGLAADLA